MPVHIELYLITKPRDNQVVATKHAVDSLHGYKSGCKILKVLLENPADVFHLLHDVLYGRRMDHANRYSRVL